MQASEFYKSIQERLHLADRTEAETASRVVLAALADRIDPEETWDLASQLPKELSDFVRRRGGPVQKMDINTFLSRIQSDLDLMNQEQAANVARGVFAVLKEAVSQGEWEDVASQLPRELQEMFETA